MKIYINRKLLAAWVTLVFELAVFLLNCSFSEKEPYLHPDKKGEINSSPPFELRTGTSTNFGQNVTNPVSGNNIDKSLILAYPYFPLVFSGFGVDHMNINIVDLSSSGFFAGDEIGVFDGIYCVGSAVIGERNLKENGLSIPASANENPETKPNGYIEGHKVTIKVYRSGVVYLLYFKTVNNSTDIFERGGSMFALVDFSKSEEQNAADGSSPNPKIYPNPFGSYLRIEVNLLKGQKLDCEIFDIAGKLIKILYNGVAEGQQLLIWDGKDNRMHKVPPGIYFCRVNQSTTKVLLNK
jgi:hypothetical protein